jgi:hypothetical protein
MAKKSDHDIDTIDDMVGKQICGLPSPNMATMAILAAFPNPTHQPVIKSIRGSFAKVAKAFKDGQCRTAVVRTMDYNKLFSPEQQANLKIMYSSPQFPEQGMTVSKRVSAQERQLITQALTVGDGINVTVPVIHSVDKQVSHFVPAKQQDYLSFNLLLEGVIYGG